MKLVTAAGVYNTIIGSAGLTRSEGFDVCAKVVLACL
jgi:hypothetical protein